MADQFHPEEPKVDNPDEFCTYCVNSPVPAVTLCLHCEAFLCEIHKRTHNKSPEHFLTDPTTFLEDKKCPVHKRIVEYYCTVDNICICLHCLTLDHNGHRVSTISEYLQQKTENMKPILEKLSSKVEKTEATLQSLQDHKKKEQQRASGITEKVTAILRDVKRQVEDLEKRMMIEISRWEEQIVSPVSNRIQQLENKKTQLLKKILQIETLGKNTILTFALEPPDVFLGVSDDDDDDLISGASGKTIYDVGKILQTFYSELSNIVTGVDKKEGLKDIPKPLPSAAHDNVSIRNGNATSESNIVLEVGRDVSFSAAYRCNVSKESQTKAKVLEYRRSTQAQIETTTAKTQDGIHIVAAESQNVPFIAIEPQNVHLVAAEPQNVPFIAAQPQNIPLVAVEPQNVPFIAAQPQNVPLVSAKPQNVSFIAAQPSNDMLVAAEPQNVSFIAAQPQNFPLVAAEPQNASFIAAQPQNAPLVAAKPQNVSLIAAQPRNVPPVAAKPQNVSFIAAQPQNVPLVAAEPQNVPLILENKSTTLEVLLDVNTASNYLLLSDDLKSVSRSDVYLGRPETPGRFQSPQVLSTRGISSGKHVLEMEVSNIEQRSGDSLFIGMGYASIDRRGSQALTGDNNNTWGIWINDIHHSVIENNRIKWLASPFSERKQITLDYEAGRLSFYDLCDPIEHVHTFTATFTQPLHLLISIQGSCWVKILKCIEEEK